MTRDCVADKRVTLATHDRAAAASVAADGRTIAGLEGFPHTQSNH